MREEADGSGVVNGQGVHSGMLSSLARMAASSPGRRGSRADRSRRTSKVYLL